MDREYLVGSYVYDCYEKGTDNAVNNYDDMFFYVLGWIIHQEYPEVFQILSTDLITQQLSI